ATVFDFLRGEEPYKYRWANNRVSNMRLRCWRSPALRAASGVQELVHRVVARGRRSLPRAAAPQLDADSNQP
ncbi:MAG TPA: hypothetical protein VE379_10650, partial [Vicinamibacterales bacterium]|nr:hypothetical protein [Vicinamibacterales bacterium]